MGILKKAIGAVEVVGGTTVAVVGGTLECALYAIGANAPGQSFSEWNESQDAFDNLSADELLLFNIGSNLIDRGMKNIKSE